MSAPFDTLAFRLYAFAVLALSFKMLALASWTSRTRLTKKVFAAPEDYASQGLSVKEGRDADVERARRAHRNDLENILPFFAVGAVYAASEPSALGAWLCYGAFTVGRVLHTLFYLNGRMPHRTVAYALGYFALLWMIFASAWSLLVR
jgi:glutathione S-transferase